MTFGSRTGNSLCVIGNDKSLGIPSLKEDLNTDLHKRVLSVGVVIQTHSAGIIRVRMKKHHTLVNSNCYNIFSKSMLQHI